MARPILPFALAVAAFSAPSRPPPDDVQIVTTYDCNETVVTQDGELVAGPDGVGWSRDLGDGMSVNLSLTLITAEDQAAFASQGFRGWASGYPYILFEFADRFDHLGRLNFVSRKLSSYRVATELRIGSRVKRSWVPVNMGATLFWHELEPMMADKGDLIATLYDVDGTVYQRGTVERAALARVEEALKAMQARALEKERDRERLCIRKDEEVRSILITG